MEGSTNNNSDEFRRHRNESVDFSGDNHRGNSSSPDKEDLKQDNSGSFFYRTRLNSVEYRGDSSRNDDLNEKKEEPTRYRTRLNSVDYNEHQEKEMPAPHHTRINSAQCDENFIQKDHRLVVVRYFLDRPGYGLDNSASRLWFHPPPICTPKLLQEFLQQQGIILQDLLVEVYLDKFQSFMLLEACKACSVEWNFADTTYRRPGVLNVRLTDLEYAKELDTQAMKNGGASTPASSPHQAPQQANTTPVGLFSFSFMVGLETTALTGKLIENSVATGFVLAWGPYMFYVGGMLQILTGIFQVLRNNIYGAVAFLGFGSFWFANGTKLMLDTHFAGDVNEELLEPDRWGTCIRSLYILAFSLVLLKQTLVMNKLSTTLISLLCCKLAVQAFSGWSEVLEWMQFGFGWITSFFAFYVFLVEFTNQVYHREVFKVHKWSAKDSPEEVFGHVGRGLTLYSKAARLRHARIPNVGRVRSVLPVGEEQLNGDSNMTSNITDDS